MATTPTKTQPAATATLATTTTPTITKPAVTTTSPTTTTTVHNTHRPQHHHHHKAANDRKHVPKGNRVHSRKSSSFSEGIASLNDAVNSAATLNSLEDDDSDMISDPSTNSYIYCDAYQYEN